MMSAEEALDNGESIKVSAASSESFKSSFWSTVAQQNMDPSVPEGAPAKRTQTARVANISPSRSSSSQWMEGVQSAISHNVGPRMANVIRSVRSHSPGPSLNNSRSTPDVGSSPSSTAAAASSSQISWNETLLDKEDQIAVLRSTLKVSEGANRALENERDSYKQQVQKLLDKIATLEQESTHPKKNSNLQNAMDEMAPIKPTSEIRESWKKLSDTQKQLSVALNQLHDTQSTLAALEVKHKGVLKQLAEVESRPSSSSTPFRNSTVNVDALQNELNHLQSEKNVFLEKISQLESQVLSFQGMNADMGPIKDKLEQTLTSMRQLELELNETQQHRVDLEQRNEELSQLLLISETDKNQLQEDWHHNNMQSQEDVDHLRQLLQNEKAQKDKMVSKLQSDHESHEKTLSALGQGYREQITDLEKQLQLSNDQLAVLNGRLDGEGHPNVMEQQITALQEECNMLKSEAEKNTLENNKALYEYETMISQLELLHSEKINLLETQLKDSDKRYRKDMDRKRSKWSDETNSLIKKHDESIGKLEGEIQSLQESVKEYELKLADAKKEVTDAEGESYSLKMRCQELEKEVSFYRSKSDHSTALQLELDKIRIAAIRLEEENKELRVVTTRESAHSPTSAELSKRDDVIKKLMDDLQVLQGEKANHVWDRMEGMTSAQDSFFTNESLIGTLENKYKNIIAELKARLADRDVSISAMVQASVTQEMTLTALKNELNTLKSEQNERSAAKDFDPHASTASTVSTDTLSEYSRKIQEKDSTITSLVKSSMNQEHQIKLLRDEMDELRSKSDSSTRSSVWVSFEQIQHESEIFAGQIIEQDEEIDDLRFQLEEHRSNAASLMSEVANLKNKLKKMESERNTAALTEEMMSLEKINSDLRDEIRELRKRLRSAQNDIDKVAELEAELAEAWRKNSKANETGDRQLYIELDELKAFKVSSEVKLAQSVMIEKQLREDIEQLQASKSLVDAKLTNSELSEKRLRTEIESLRSSASSSNQFVAQLDALTAYKMQLEDKVRKSEEKEALVRRSEEHLKAQLLQLVNRNADLQQRIELLESSTQEINLRDSRDGQLDTSLIAQLQNDIKEQDDIISALTVELKRSREAPKPGRDVQNIETTIRQEFEEELSSMRSQKEYFAQEVARLQNELQKNENDIILQLRAELQQIEESRSEHEKNMVTTFERKLSLMQMNKDLTIDSLRKDLSKFKAEAREMENNLLSKVSELEAEKLRLEERLATELQYKDSQIRHLEQNLAAHQQVSGHMKEELDQLQSGMESVSVNRRAEVEELQQDIINIQSKLKFYERENTSLKMRMEEQKGRYDEEIQKLNFQMFEQQSDSVKASSAGDSNHQRLYSEALVRMESLKNKLSSLQDENAKLREKIETLNDSQSKNDKWRNSALQEQVITLTQRLKEVEGDSGSVGSSSTYKSRKSRSSVLEDSFSGIDSDKYGDMDSAKAGSRVSTPSKGSMAMDSPSPALPPRTGSRSVDSEKFSDMESAKPSSRTSTPSRTPTADAPSPYPPRSTLRSNSQTRDRPWSRGD